VASAVLENSPSDFYMDQGQMKILLFGSYYLIVRAKDDLHHARVASLFYLALFEYLYFKVSIATRLEQRMGLWVGEFSLGFSPAFQVSPTL
jgi:hypothetical protein